jgi:hypothetical protein
MVSPFYDPSDNTSLDTVLNVTPNISLHLHVGTHVTKEVLTPTSSVSKLIPGENTTSLY